MPGNFLDLEVGVEEQLHSFLVQTPFQVSFGAHAGVPSKSHREGVKGGTVGPRKFFNAQIGRQFPFDQVKDGIELGMRLDVLDNDLIQVGHGPRDPIQDSGLGLDQLVESGFVF